MFGERLRKLRENLGLSQEQLGKKVSVSTSSIGMYEQNRRQPDNETLKKLSELFGVTTDYLLGNDEATKELINYENVDKRVIRELLSGLNDPLNQALFSKASQLKSDKDKKIVLSVMQGLMDEVDEELDK